MGRPDNGRAKWPQVNIRLNPTLYSAMQAHLHDPLYIGAAYGSVAEFISTAIERELTLRGIQCQISESSSSPQSKEVEANSPEYCRDF